MRQATLKPPKITTGQLSVKCIDKTQEYHFIDELGVFRAGTLAEISLWFAEKLLSLGENGGMDIDILRMSYEDALPQHPSLVG